MNYLEILNEAIALLISDLAFLFTDASTIHLRLAMGWLWLLLFGLMFIMNTLAHLIQIFGYFKYRIYYRYCRKRFFILQRVATMRPETFSTSHDLLQKAKLQPKLKKKSMNRSQTTRIDTRSTIEKTSIFGSNHRSLTKFKEDSSISNQP
jgi:hypothetical protein